MRQSCAESDGSGSGWREWTSGRRGSNRGWRESSGGCARVGGAWHESAGRCDGLGDRWVGMECACSGMRAGCNALRAGCRETASACAGMAAGWCGSHTACGRLSGAWRRLAPACSVPDGGCSGSRDGCVGSARALVSALSILMCPREGQTPARVPRCFQRDTRGMAPLRRSACRVPRCAFALDRCAPRSPPSVLSHARKCDACLAISGKLPTEFPEGKEFSGPPQTIWLARPKLSITGPGESSVCAE